ncbi:MAG: hypothetical protein OXG79_13735 [Chloroflexi bacterium]|nr:hypothetical protein [Chloroflexota bacterium]
MRVSDGTDPIRVALGRARDPRTHSFVIALALLPWLALLGWLASVGWFITDDAFISFRYVRNLLDGHGLVFNPGEYVEGYTNFLWVLELAAIWRVLGIRPEDVAQWLSVIYTVGTIAVMLWWVARMPFLRHRGLVAWMALGLIGSSATFAVWTSGGGLETRQFTFFALVAVAALSVFGANRWALLAASLSLAAAALTRPEGLLVAACCVGWFVAHRWFTARKWDWRGTLALAGPFVVLIGGHFLARYRYYGEWLPNTYYAKHVGPWYESGFRYLWAAAMETGLYLLIPLAVVALRGRWREHRDGIYALVLLLVGTHMAYLFEIGGDYFEYRPMDHYWPLLAVPAAEGVVRVGAWLSNSLRQLSRRLRWAGPRTLAVALFVPLLFYANALQAALLFEGKAVAKLDGSQSLQIALGNQNTAWLLAAPGMPVLVAVSNDLRSESEKRLVGLRTHQRSHHAHRIRKWKPYEDFSGQVIPSDAVTVMGAVGIAPYFVPTLEVVDSFGLVDATVARNPVTPTDSERRVAHDRSPPPGYLQRRGVNIRLHSSVATEAEALARANYAVEVGPGIWMPFDAYDHAWANARFGDLGLRAENRFSQDDPAGNRVIKDDVRYVGEEFLGRFEDRGLDGWRRESKAVTNHILGPFYDRVYPVEGHVGPGFLTTYYPGKWERTGEAYSPVFTARDDQYLMFLIAGERHDFVGLRLLADGEEVAVWRGDNWRAFEMVIYPLRQLAGKELQLEIFNHEIGDRPRLMLDHVMLVRRES